MAATDADVLMQEDASQQADIELETPADDVFIAPSIHRDSILAGDSYSHFSPLPRAVQQDSNVECVLGVDEAGRGPVLGPMVYGIFYLPMDREKSLLKDAHHFDDSKALTANVRSKLMEALCTPGTDLHDTSGWATCVMSAKSIAANMMKPNGSYNLNAQAMDTTVDLIQGAFERGVNVKEIYVDTIGQPITYQKKLEKIFPTTKVTVAKKADSLYPCVSAASVCAKVTRDAALEVCYEAYQQSEHGAGSMALGGWGSGYPSDARCSTWLKKNMHPVFGWGPECRFSWGTAKDLLEGKSPKPRVDWPEEEDDDTMKLTSFFAAGAQPGDEDQYANWFGGRVTEEIF